MTAALEDGREPAPDMARQNVDDWTLHHQGASDGDRVRQDLLGALAGKDAQGSRRVADRTRRSVRVAVVARREEKAGKRRSFAVAIAFCLGILTLLAPAMWSSLDDLGLGEHFGDLPMQLTLLLIVLLPAVIAALLASMRTQGLQSGHRSH